MSIETLRHPVRGRRSHRRPPRRHAALRVPAAREVDVVLNARASGVGGSRDVARRATAALRAAGADVRVRVTADVQELADVVVHAGDRRVVLVGGDGTIHALANLPLTVLPAVALLPAGRANNIARAVGIPTDWDAAARLAVRGPVVATDALRVVTPERELFAVEGVSAGFHAAARSRYTGENSADLQAGVRALAAELGAYHEHAVDLRVDGVSVPGETAAQVFLSNLPFFGFGFRVDPLADPFDGRLEAIVLRASTRRGVVRLLAAARDGRHLTRSGVSWLRGSVAQLAVPVPLVADAEPLGTTTATVSVSPGRLHLVAPGGPGAAAAAGRSATALSGVAA